MRHIDEMAEKLIFVAMTKNKRRGTKLYFLIRKTVKLYAVLHQQMATLRNIPELRHLHESYSK